MKKPSEQTLITALVNFKCVGYFGKCFRPFTLKEREKAVDTMIERGWLTENPLKVTTRGDEVVKNNLSLSQY